MHLTPFDFPFFEWELEELLFFFIFDEDVRIGIIFLNFFMLFFGYSVIFTSLCCLPLDLIVGSVLSWWVLRNCTLFFLLLWFKFFLLLLWDLSYISYLWTCSVFLMKVICSIFFMRVVLVWWLFLLLLYWLGSGF